MAITRSGPTTKDTSTVALGLAKVCVGPSAANIANRNQVLDQIEHSLGALNTSNFTSTVEYWRLMSGFPSLEDLSIPLSEVAALECEFKELHPRNLAIARGIDATGVQNASVTVVGSDTTSGTTDASQEIEVRDDQAGVVTDTWTVVFTDGDNYDVYGLETGHVGAGTVAGAFSPDNEDVTDDYSEFFTIPAAFFTGTWAGDDTFVFRTVAYSATGGYDDPHSGEINLGSMAAPAFVRAEAIYTYPNQTNHMYIIFPRANVTSSLELSFNESENANVPITIEAKRADDGVTGGHNTWNVGPLGRIYFD